MRLLLMTALRRHRVFAAALSATVLASIPAHAQAAAQPAKPPAPKSSAAAVKPAQAPASKATPAAATTQQPTPAKATQPVAKPAQSPAAKLAQPITPNRIYIDINHATLKELKNIPGVGDVYGKKIIAGRPYANKSQLVSRKIIDAGLYETIQGMIIAKQ